MIKKLLYLSVTLFFSIGYSQVGIGTTNPNASSMLDITSTTSGILIPRMTIAQRDLITSPATGLLIYQNDSTPGFYYYNGTAWTPFGSSGWSLTGNSGTSATTNFIGTTDGTDFVIKVGGTEAMRVKNGGNVGIGSNNPSAKLHVSGTTTVAGTNISTLFTNDFTSGGITSIAGSGNTCTTSPNIWHISATSVYAACTTCAGNRAYIQYSVSCAQNQMFKTTNFSPTTNTISISFKYGYDDFDTGDSFVVTLYNETTNTVAATLLNLTSDALSASYASNSTVIPGNSYSVRYTYIGNNDWGASVDTIVITESIAVAGSYVFRLEDGTQAAGKVMVSDANGNGYWGTATSGTDNQSLSISGSNLSISNGNTVALPVGTDSQSLSISGNNLTISNGNTITLPSGSGSYTFTNGLTNTSGTVRLGGTLTQETTLNLDAYDLNFNSSTSAAFPGQIIFNGTNRVIMETNFDEDYINFGGGSTLVDGDDGITFLDSGGDTYTRDFALGFYKGSQGGSAMATGSIEYLVDGLDELLLEASSFNPLVDNDTRLGASSKRWTAVWATNGIIQTSDMKLKKDVSNLKYGLKEVMKLNPISYKWINNSIGKTSIPEQFQETKLGFSAQQLQEILPEIVETHSWYPKDEEGNFERKQNENLGVRYAEITPVLVNAIQEQQEQIIELKKTVEELKKQNELLLQLVNKK